MREYDSFEVYEDGKWVEVDRGTVDAEGCLVYLLDGDYGVADPGEWRYQCPGHDIKVISLRDLIVECSCGRWSLMSPTTDRDSDEALRAKAKLEHARHASRNA